MQSSFKSTSQTFTKITTRPSKALLASYKISHRIAKNTKFYENLVLPAVIDNVWGIYGTTDKNLIEDLHEWTR